MPADLNVLTEAEKRVASATVASLAEQMDLGRVTRVFRVLRKGDALIPLQKFMNPDQLPLLQPPLARSERYWAAAAVFVLHMELDEESANRVIQFLGQSTGVIDALLWLSVRTAPAQKGSSIPN
jgi:hypothetical protein